MVNNIKYNLPGNTDSEKVRTTKFLGVSSL